jgi:cytochrome P450
LRRRVQQIDGEIHAQIARRRSEEDLERRDDILSLLIRARDPGGEHLTDGELRDELVTLLLAGHQNTAATLAWAIHELAHDPESQQRLSAEPCDFADPVIKETLRLHPPVPLVVRRLREPLRIAGYELTAGTNLGPCALLAHRRADLYPDPLAFRPQRWLERRPALGEWFPFGGSDRRCVGAALAQFEARIFLQELIRLLRVAPADALPEPARPRAVVLVPGRGARIIASRR